MLQRPCVIACAAVDKANVHLSVGNPNLLAQGFEDGQAALSTVQGLTEVAGVPVNEAQRVQRICEQSFVP